MSTNRRILSITRWLVPLSAGLAAFLIVASSHPEVVHQETPSRIEIPLTSAPADLGRRLTGSFDAGGESYRVVVESTDGNPASTRLRFAKLADSDASTEWLRLYGSVDLGGVIYEIFSLSRQGDRLLLVERSFVMRRPTAPKPGDLAPAIRAVTLHGEAIDLADFRGKYVLLDFWGTWCAPCIENTPNLEAVRVRYGRDLVVVGIAQDSAENVRAYEKSRPVPMPQIIQESMEDEVIVAYGVRQFPTYYLIDPRGVIVSSNVTQLSGENLKRNIQFLLR